MRKLPLLSFLLLVVVLAFMLLHKGEPVMPGSGTNAAFPTIQVTTLEGGKKWDAKALKHHVTLVNFFASWCAPCMAEMPELAALKKKYPSISITGIAWNDDPLALKKWLKEHGNPYDSLWFDKNGDATIDLGIKGIPETLLVDGEGVIRYRLAGPITPTVLEGEFSAVLETLVTEVAGAR